MRLQRSATIEVRQNLSLVLRERGKIQDRRDGHNIWLELGSDYLAKLIAYKNTSTLETYRDDRIRYMGLGIGGTRQLMPAVANTSPLVEAYPGTHNQTDADPWVKRLERPVRVSGTSELPPYNATLDTWLAQVQSPPTFGAAGAVTFRRLFTQVEVSYLPFLTVPLSEVALFTHEADPRRHNNTAVAYDTFDPLSKTSAFELEVEWTIRF